MQKEVCGHKNSKWFYIRVVIIVISVIMGIVPTFVDVSDDHPNAVYSNDPIFTTFAVVMMLILIPLFMLVVLGSTKKFPFSNKMLIKPNWQSPLLDINDPVNILYTISLAAITEGTSSLISNLLVHNLFSDEGLIHAVGGLSAIIGIKLFIWRNKDRFQAEPSQ